MQEGREFRELLVADLVLLRGVASARDVAMAIQRYWERSPGERGSIAEEIGRLANLAPGALAPVEAEADRLVAEAGGNAQVALTRHGGLDRSIHLALSAQGARISHALTQIGAGARSELRPVANDRYVDFIPAGEGGMGVVYMALDTELNRLVAFKMVRPDVGSGHREEPPRTPIDAATPDRDTPASQAFEELKGRFLQEAWVTGGLEHPGIVPVYELGQTPKGIPYYTMRFVRGQRTLKDALDEVRDAPVEDRLALLEPLLKLCDTVRYAHSRGVIHRDLKPDNVALGEFGEVVLLDWGLAKLEGRDDLAASRWQERVREFREAGDLRTVAGALGTPGYMSPEAAMGRLEQVDQKSDVYSLGVVLFEILTGKLPFEFRTYAEYLDRVAGEEAPRAGTVAPGVPEGLDALCARCLAQDRTERPDDVAALSKAIRSWQASSALEREIEGHLLAALDAAEAARGDDGLRQVERAAGALEQVATQQADHPDLRVLRNQADTLRETGIREREKASGRKLLVRVGIVALALAAVAAVVVAGLLEGRRKEAEAARVAAQEAQAETVKERDAKAVALEEKKAALSVAKRERDAMTAALAEKSKALDDVLRLSDSKSVSDLVDEVETLWPIHPDRAGAMDAWLTRAKAVLAKRADHEWRLVRMRERGTRHVPDDGSEEGTTWTFGDDQDAWMHEVLSDLQVGLGRIEALRTEIQSRHEAASTLEKRSVKQHAGLWRETIEKIAASERYGGLRLEPQLGLVPLGPDPDSGLFEFAHLGSGTVPERSEEDGRLRIEDDSALVLVLIPGGTFWMGAQRKDPEGRNFDPQANDDESDRNGHAFERTVPPFFLSKYECTQAQWKQMTGGLDPSRYKAGQDLGGHTLTGRNPVEQVNWKDCLGDGPGEGWLRRHRLTLPTETWWEHACRAGTDTPWHPGLEASSLQGYANIADAWCKANGGRPSWAYTEEVDDGHTVEAPVGSFLPNAFGLFDVHGNVWELCRDLRGSYPPTEERLEAGPGDRVLRGGSWRNDAWDARSALRSGSAPGIRDASLGFRPAMAVTP